MPTKFGQRIRELRVAKGLSQPQVAESAGIDVTYLSKIENERVPPPSEDVISKLAQVFKCNQEDLLLLGNRLPGAFVDQVRRDPLAADFLRIAPILTRGQRQRIRQIIDEPERD